MHFVSDESVVQSGFEVFYISGKCSLPYNFTKWGVGHKRSAMFFWQNLQFVSFRRNWKMLIIFLRNYFDPYLKLSLLSLERCRLLTFARTILKDCIICCWSCIAYSLSCHETASDANYWTIRKLLIAKIRNTLCLQEFAPAWRFPLTQYVFVDIFNFLSTAFACCSKPPSRYDYRNAFYPKTQQCDQGLGWTKIMQ